MSSFTRAAAIGCLSVLALPVCAFAQGDPRSAIENAPLQFGPLALQPRFSLTNFGIDTNVGNVADTPRRDFTMTVVPGLDSWLAIGPTLLSGRTSYELLYFKKTANQRGASFSQTGRFDLLFPIVRPHVEGGRTTTHQRPNSEIDARVEQTIKTAGAGVMLNLSPRTTLDFSTVTNWIDVADQQFLGVNLRSALSHRTQSTRVSLRRSLTPFTTFGVTASVDRDRFAQSSIRDANSVSVIPSLDFNPSALISGTASVGVRSFQPLDESLRGYRGVVAAVKLTYVLREWTKVTVHVDRDVAYSFQDATPYFVTTGFGFTVYQSIGGNWDAAGRYGREQMAYTAIAEAGDPPTGTRVDRRGSYGLGLGYRLSSATRIGFDGDYTRRVSSVQSRQYDGYRFGGSFIYEY